MRLEDLGYDAFFASGRKESRLDGYAVARVIAEHRGAYKVKDASSEYLARITGKQIFNSSSREDYPAVGDWVAVTAAGAGKAVIHGVLPRKTVLKRRYGGGQGPQVIAANLDIAFVIGSVDRDYNLNRFERYLAIAADGDIRPIIVLNKVDMIPAPELDRRINQIKNRFRDIRAIPTSAVREIGLEELETCVPRGETCCFLGSSGVGKSSLINKLLGVEAIKTSATGRHTGRGKHTTTGREMYFLENGGIVMDNPGMREIGMTDAGAGIERVFDEMAVLARRCRFDDCTHTHEPGCAVREAVESGELDEGRYRNYLKLTKETEHYEMTSLEKRRKDREFGRFIKKAKDDQRKRDL